MSDSFATAQVNPEHLAFLRLVNAKLARDGKPIAGYYAVDDKRYLLDIPTKGKWKGWLFLSTGSDYHDRKRLLMRKPTGEYMFASTRGQEVLAAILADPIGCMQAYGSITGRCAVCSRKLEDQNSVALGIGPICLNKLLGA